MLTQTEAGLTHTVRPVSKRKKSACPRNLQETSTWKEAESWSQGRGWGWDWAGKALALGFMSQITARPAVMSSRARSHAKGSLHRCRVHWWKPGSKIMNGRACVYHSTLVCGWCIAAMLDSRRKHSLWREPDSSKQSLLAWTKRQKRTGNVLATKLCLVRTKPWAQSQHHLTECGDK